MISRFRLISGIFAALLASSAFAIPSYAYPTDEIESLRTQQAQTLRDFNVKLGATEAVANRLASAYIENGFVMSMSTAEPISTFTFVENSRSFVVKRYADGSATLEQYPFSIRAKTSDSSFSNKEIEVITKTLRNIISLRAFDKCDSFSQGAGWSGGIGCPFSVDNGIVSIGLQFDFTGVGGGYGSTISNPRGPWSRGVLTSCSYPQIVHHTQKHTASGPASVTLTAQCNNVLGSTTHYAQFRHEYAKFTQDIW